MRLLELKEQGEFKLTKDLVDSLPPYAILSHTWGSDEEEATFQDLMQGIRKSEAIYRKIQFCAEQATHDGLYYIWVDTCCIDKSNYTELSEAINSMFRWYKEATKCYIYLSDVQINSSDQNIQLSDFIWQSAFRKSRWFTRGWTLQELIAPVSVEFFSREGIKLGDKQSLKQQIHQATGIPIDVLQGGSLSHFSVSERISWAKNRETKRKEDKVYSLMGIFDIHMPLIYGEGREKAFVRLHDEINKRPRNDIESSVTIDNLFKQDHTRKCLTSLNPTDQRGLRARAMTRYQSACQWFLNESRFQEWKTDYHSDLLYITANAGCGKTTVAAHVIKALEEDFIIDIPRDQDQTERKLETKLLLYFFFQRINIDDEGTASAALRTIIMQLIHQMPNLYHLLQRQYDILALKQHISWTWDPLLSVFLGMMQQIRDRAHTSLYIVLDGLDECSSDSRGKLLECLDSLVRDQRTSTIGLSRSVFKVLVTSRPDEETFDTIPSSKHFEITDELTTEDVDTLIIAGVEQLGSRRHLAVEVQSAIKSFLHANAKGMFLWVVLVLQELDRRDERLTDDLIASRLRKVPLTLASVYESILENTPISRHEDMWYILHYMLISFRVMSTIELKSALCVELGISEWHDFIVDIKQLCGSLVRITNEKIYFIHQSARDFLETYAYRTSKEVVNRALWKFEEAELHIAIVCLRYLLQDTLFVEVYNTYPGILAPSGYSDLMHDVLKRWPFLSYAAEYWAFHLRSLAHPNSAIAGLVFDLLDTEINRDMLMRLIYFFTHYSNPSTPRYGTQLHIAAYFNLPWFVMDYINRGVDYNDIADCGDTALVWGSEMGSTDSVKLLLQAGADPNIVEHDGWSALHWAATNGHADICKLLIEHGANINAVDRRGTTPRDWAIARGH